MSLIYGYSEMLKLTLASQSPRRKELLEGLGIPFSIRPANINEDISFKSPLELATNLSKLKASALECLSGEVIVASDTVVAIDGEVLGKPGDLNQARDFLNRLSGKTHQVITGVTLLNSKESKTFAVETEVEFYSISDELLEQYLLTQDSLDKSGGYGIQGQAQVFIKSLRGSYSSVVGLPMAELYLNLREFCRLRSGQKLSEIFS